MSGDNDALMLDSAGPTAKGFGLKMHAGGPQTAETLLFIADSMRSMLDEHNAPNYLEMELQAGDRKQYIMTLQRKGHVTPHQARVAAEQALEAYKPQRISYVVITRDGRFVKEFGGDKVRAEAFANESTRDCKDAEIDWDYRVAEIVEVQA